MRITGSQIAAAIALLRNVTTEELAQKAGVSRSAISGAMQENSVPREDTIMKIRGALEDCGIEFIGTIGVQWAQHQVRSLVGTEGLKAFFDDVRATVRKTDEEIVISGVSEEYLEQKLGTYLDHHREEMAEIGKVRMRCLIKDGDPNVGASEYCQYRWQSKENFSNVPFYIYGDKMAVIVTTGPEDPLTLLIHNRTIAKAYRLQFEIMWGVAKEIPANEGKK